MLRPATPLTVLLFSSFVLLLLSVLSTPIIKGIPIANLEEVNFGVFGFCTPRECSGIRIGYSTDGLFGPDNGDADFSLPSSARASLSSLLIVHPVAALFNLICLGLAGAAHLHTPSHSARYLLALLILLLPTLLVTLLAFLVDILLFVPHLQWGGWIVLASTILITASGVVTCAMRRTLVSRKARKKRIAENAEMSGENFYNRQNTQAKMDAISPISTGEPKVPMVNGAPGSNSLPTFATFTKEHDPSEGRSDFSRITPTNRMASEPMGEGLGPTRSRSHDRYRGVTDEFGGPIPSSNAVGGVPPHLRRDPSDPSLRQMPSWDRVNELPPRGGFGYGGPRGRGGYPARGGYGPPRGGFTGPRGGPGQGFGRGAFNDGRGNYYNGRGRGSAVASGYMGRPGPGPPPGYPPQGQGISPERYGSQEESSRRPSQGSGSASSGPRQQSPGTPLRRPSPGMAPPSTQDHYFVGQAVEMNASTGRISQAGGRAEEGEAVHRMITVPENHSGIPPDQASPSSQYSSAEAPRPPFAATQQNMSNTSSMYSNPPENYVPPRAAWANNSRTNSPSRGPPGNNNPAASTNNHQSRPRASSQYYEDVDPRFSDINATNPAAPPDESPTLPTSLTPGGPSLSSRPPRPPLQDTPSDENLPDGTRSPAGSEVSHFTSVSQRGVNPRWRAGNDDMNMRGAMPLPSKMIMMRNHPGLGPGPVPGPGRDVLQGNPDFEIPGMRPPGRVGPGNGGMMGAGGGASMQQPGGGGPMNGLTGVGRYPPP